MGMRKKETAIFHLNFLILLVFKLYTHEKEPACQCRRYRRRGFSFWIRKIPWRRKWPPTPVCLPGKSYGQRSPAGYCPWGRKESDVTERLAVHTQTHDTVITVALCLKKKTSENRIAGFECEMLVRHTPVSTHWKSVLCQILHYTWRLGLPVNPLGRHFHPQFAGAETQANEVILWVNLRAKIQAHIRPATNHAFPISPGC